MNRSQTLTKAVAIAKRNGYDISDDFFTEIPTETWLQEGQDLYFSFIFDHGFAKYFFGENSISIEGCEKNLTDIVLSDIENPMASLMANKENIRVSSWEYHLVQMVLSADPLLYIHNFIEDIKQA